MHAFGLRFMSGEVHSTVVRKSNRFNVLHGPSLGGWIAILYTTIAIGSSVLGLVIRSPTPQGFAVSYVIGFALSLALWYVTVKTNRSSQKE